MEAIIRPIKLEDATDLSELLQMSVTEVNTLNISSSCKISAEECIKSIAKDVHVLVTDAQSPQGSKVIGYAAIKIDSRARSRHTGLFEMSFHRDFYDKESETALIERMLDLADNWLFLKRLELFLLSDDTLSRNKYKSFGFEEEGVLRSKLLVNTEYMDICIMGRVRRWMD